MFDLLRELAVSQGLVGVGGMPPASSRRLCYTFLGKPVCFEAFATLLGVGKHGRLGRLRQAVMDGATAPPMDMRLVQARSAHAQPSAQWAEVFSYLTGLYESVAETMPDDSKSLLLEHADGAEYNINVAGDTGPAPLQDLRFLPPGSIFEQWRQFVEVIQPCSFKLFWTVWRREFARLLAFRQANQFSVCPVCTKHRLLLRELTGDAGGRLRQRLLYDRHLAAQYRDRVAYWTFRASSRLRQRVITIILDGMDQSKFAWPKAPFFHNNHEFEHFARPRLHIWGAIVHGFCTLLTVSHADVFKGGSTTVQVITWLLDKLKSQGVQLHEYQLHIQLDNTSGSNKNNTVLAWAAAIVAAGVVSTCTIGFLRVGHTHEDAKSNVVPHPRNGRCQVGVPTWQ